MKFIKMHGLGNDYVFVDCIGGEMVARPEEAARIVSRQHFGIGADGLVLIEPSESADARMRIFNKDGSEAEMCGNAIRCIGKYLYDSHLCRRQKLSIQTGAGVLPLELIVEAGTAVGATVDMGIPRFEPERIPVLSGGNRVSIVFEGKTYSFFCLSIGNPHAVTCDAFPDGYELARFGRFIETHPLFPGRINVEFCSVEAMNRARVRVWERGSGATLACGTGASAALVALSQMGVTERCAAIALPGGELEIAWRGDGHVYMTGPAAVSFTGEIFL